MAQTMEREALETRGIGPVLGLPKEDRLQPYLQPRHGRGPAPSVVEQVVVSAVRIALLQPQREVLFGFLVERHPPLAVALVGQTHEDLLGVEIYVREPEV